MVSVGVGSVGLVKVNWVGSINVLGKRNSAVVVSSPLSSGWVWVVWNITDNLLVSSESHGSFIGISGSDVFSVSSSDISLLSSLESLLRSNNGSSLLLAWYESGIRWTEWLLSVHGVEFGVGDSSEWGSSSVHHVDSRGGIVPFLGIGLEGISGIVLGNHNVVLFLESFLLGSSGSRGISSFLPGSSRIIRSSSGGSGKKGNKYGVFHFNFLKYILLIRSNI